MWSCWVENKYETFSDRKNHWPFFPWMKKTLFYSCRLWDLNPRPPSHSVVAFTPRLAHRLGQSVVIWCFYRVYQYITAFEPPVSLKTCLRFCTTLSLGYSKRRFERVQSLVSTIKIYSSYFYFSTPTTYHRESLNTTLKGVAMNSITESCFLCSRGRGWDSWQYLCATDYMFTGMLRLAC